jgi:hypothetical protein
MTAKESAMKAIREVTGPFGWRGADLAGTGEWIETITPDEVAEVEAAMRAVQARGLQMQQVRKDDFVLPTLGKRLQRLALELEGGRGFVLLRGLPVQQYPEEQTRFIVWGIGAHLGIPVSQSKNGEFLGEVRDLGVKLGTPTSRGYRSNEHLRFHTDLADLVLLLCVRKAKEGGLSRIVSSVAVHNEMLRRRPDLLELLYADYYHSRQGEEAPGEGPWYAKPVVGVRDGFFTSQYSRSFVESAQRFPDVPRLTGEQNAALDLLAALADELCLEMEMEAGDIQILNNHVTYHSRTGYVDHDEPSRQRLLYRLWLSTPANRPLPDSERTIWGAVEAGSLRGGVTPASGPRYAFGEADR